MNRRFDRLLKDARQYVPELEVTLHVGEAQEFPKQRDYAYCEHCMDNTSEIYVSPGFEDLPPIKQEALLRHELAHAIEFALGTKRAHHEFGPMLARTPERRADQIAELIWDEPILYDEEGIQTLDQGHYPRPARLGL